MSNLLTGKFSDTYYKIKNSKNEKIRKKIEYIRFLKILKRSIKIFISIFSHFHGTGGIPTTDNIPETTEIFGCQTDNISENRFFKTPNFNIFI